MKAQRKRQRGSGSVFRKKPGKLWNIQYYDGNGRRIREATGEREWAEAAKLLKKRLGEVASGLPARRGKPPQIAALFEALEKDNANNGRNVDECQKRWKHLKPAFAATRADQLTTGDLRAYISTRQKEGAGERHH